MSITQEDITRNLETLGLPYKQAFNTAYEIFNRAGRLHEALAVLTDDQLEIVNEHYPAVLNLADWFGSVTGGRRFNKQWLQSRARAQFEDAVFAADVPDI